jgi:hypothetical protein
VLGLNGMQISTTKTLRKDLDPERPLKFKTDSFSRGGGWSRLGGLPITP